MWNPMPADVLNMFRTMYCFQRGLAAILFVSYALAANETSRSEAREYLNYYGETLAKYYNKLVLADWNYETNMTDENWEQYRAVRRGSSGVLYKTFPWTEYDDADLLRQANKFGLFDREARIKGNEPYNKMCDTIDEMVAIHTGLTVCQYNNRSNCDVTLDDIDDVLYKSTKPDVNKYYWLAYQNQISEKMKPYYPKYVNFSNTLAHLFKYPSRAEQWMSRYEEPPVEEFEDSLITLYQQFRPLYLQLHAFLRKRLYFQYGPCAINRTGPIPIHLTGSVLGDIFFDDDRVRPYPLVSSLDITSKLKKKNFTVHSIAKLCEDHYMSMGLPAMPESFWELSLFEKPKDREATCTTSSWDFYDGKDFRMMICAEVTFSSLLSMCHEMGHVQYEMGYKDQPVCYRAAPNLGIDEGYASVASLTFYSTSRLIKLGLVEDLHEVDQRVEINRLFTIALDVVYFLPYALLVDLWRYRYFRGDVDDSNTNKEWWRLRLEYQGLVPPEPRPDDGLDATSKIHIVDNTEYIDYFIASVVQFQIHEALCVKSGEYDPINNKNKTLRLCDIYGSQEAGRCLKDMFSLGSSKTWPYVLQKVTEKPYLDARPILEYFEELHQWLIEDNERTGEVIGW